MGIITLARNSLQNPERKRVGGQNLENRGLASVVFSTVCTASALTILGSLRIGRKVRCHNAVVDNRVWPYR